RASRGPARRAGTVAHDPTRLLRPRELHARCFARGETDQPPPRPDRGPREPAQPLTGPSRIDVVVPIVQKGPRSGVAVVVALSALDDESQEVSNHSLLLTRK